MQRRSAVPAIAVRKRSGEVAPTVVTILWLLLGFGLYCSQTWLIQTLGIWMTIPVLVHGVWGIVQAAVFTVLLFFGRRDVRILLPMMLISGVMFFYGGSLFRRVGDQIAFHFVRAPFDATVAVEASGNRPVFVAFEWQAKSDWRDPFGHIWDDLKIQPTGRAIVYDETDTINLVDERTWTKTSPRLGEILNGKPQRCIRFAEPHYFLCGFR